jgi:hypothetical protein
VTTQTLNYTVVAVGIIAIFSVGSWVLWAHRWFVGPIKEFDGQRLGVVNSLDSGPLEAAADMEQVLVVNKEKN